MSPQPGSHSAPRNVGDLTRCATSSASSHSMPPMPSASNSVDLLADASHVGGRGRDLEEARALEVAVELVLGDRGFERVDGAFHVVVRLAHAALSVACDRMAASEDAEQGHHEAGVAAAGAEAAGFGFEDGDVERRLGAFEVVGGGKAGVAGADDGDVDGDVARERRRGHSSAPGSVPRSCRQLARASALIPSPERT